MWVFYVEMVLNRLAGKLLEYFWQVGHSGDLWLFQIVESILSEENRDQELTDNIIIGKWRYVVQL